MIDQQPASASRSAPGRRVSSATTNSMAAIGITDCVICSETSGSDTSVSPLSTRTTAMPVTASRPKKKMVTAEASRVAATRQFGGNALTRPGNPICAPRSAASAPA